MQTVVDLLQPGSLVLARFSRYFRKVNVTIVFVEIWSLRNPEVNGIDDEETSLICTFFAVVDLEPTSENFAGGSILKRTIWLIGCLFSTKTKNIADLMCKILPVNLFLLVLFRNCQSQPV